MYIDVMYIDQQDSNTVPCTCECGNCNDDGECSGFDCECECDSCEGDGCAGHSCDCNQCPATPCDGCSGKHCPGCQGEHLSDELVCTDGCPPEADYGPGAVCTHGHVTWLRWYGMA